MPELPEVEVVRAGLEPAVTTATVTAVTIFDQRSLRRHEGPTEDFVARLTGAVLGLPKRRGKFLWIPLTLVEPPTLVEPASLVEPVETIPATPVSTSSTSETALTIHLGMSGQVLLRDQQTDDNLTRIRIDLTHPSRGPLRLNFVDQRIFGSMALDELVSTGSTSEGGVDELIPSQVTHIARDPLDPLFDDDAFFAKLAKRNTGIKRALLDQGLISGIGNIYADESLWMSRIHYEQPTATLTRPRARLLLAQVRAVLHEALAEGGTSFDAQYLNVNGVSGYFAHSLKAYGQQGTPCQRCSTLIVREQFMNRGSHFCPHCQKVPRTSV